MEMLLMYEAMTEYGEVKVSVSPSRAWLMSERQSYDHSRINVFHTEKTPQEVLEEFESIVCQNLEGVLGGIAKSRPRNKPFFRIFLSPNAYKYHHDLSKNKERKSDDNDRLINQRILPLYDVFVRQFLST